MRLFPVSLKRFVLKRKIRIALFLPHFFIGVSMVMQLSPRIHKIFQSGFLKEEKKLRRILFHVLLEKGSRFQASNFLFTLEKCLFFQGHILDTANIQALLLKGMAFAAFLLLGYLEFQETSFCWSDNCFFIPGCPFKCYPDIISISSKKQAV